MRYLTTGDVDEVKKRTDAGAPLSETVPAVLGGVLLDHGFWRFFSSNEKCPLVLARWNEPNSWKNAWGGLASLPFWGEDVFGNQILLDGKGDLYLWNHENAAVVVAEADFLTILEATVDHGLGWLDFYSDGSYSLVRDRLAELSIESHWHWTQPRILGGQVTAKNLTLIDRIQHMVGHGQLWLQVRDMPPGSQISIKL